MSMLNLSSSPHIRRCVTTGTVMRDVIIALLPVTVVGIWHFGISAAMVLLVSVVSAVVTEWLFDRVTHRPNTVRDNSAVVTGLLLGLSLSSKVPLYVPVLGSVFAILVVKCLFGGLGQNIMNPALAGRCFVMVSFGTAMTDFAVDGMSSATPLAILAQGGNVPDLLELFLGVGSTTGTIACSSAALLLGGIYLLAIGTITWHIPVGFLAGFGVTISLLGGRGLDLPFLLTHMMGGGLMIGAFFMATDPVTSPSVPYLQTIYGTILGVLTGVFRIYGNTPENISFAMIIGDLFVPLLDRLPVPKPFGFGVTPETAGKRRHIAIPRAAVVLTVITLFSGIALGGVHTLTKDAIAVQNEKAAAAAYAEVIPGAVSIENLDLPGVLPEPGTVYGTDFGKVYINKVVVGTDGSDNVVGYGINATSGEAFDGSLSLSVGIAPDGTVLGISFTELHETAGMGMNADTSEWKEQFKDVATDAFTVVKGGKTAIQEIDAVSGATRTSNAVVNAVNAALDFFARHVR